MTEPLLLARIASLPFARLETLRAKESAAELARATERVEAVEEEAAALEARLFAAAGPAPSASVAGFDEASGGVALAIPRTSLLQARRDVRHGRRDAIARAARDLAEHDPDLAERLDRFVALLDETAAAVARHRRAHERALAASAARLLEACGDPRIEEGVRLASRALLEKAERLRALPFAGWKHRERHTALKLAAYLARAASKTSPNGVLCSTALAAVGDRVACDGAHAIVRSESLLAVGEARKIAASLAVDPELAALVRPRPNETLRENQGRWTFWRFASLRRAEDEEVLSALAVHPIARAMLDLCAPERDMAGLIAETSRRTGLAEAELESFARKLVEVGLLIAEVEVPWSERRPLSWIAAQARAAGCAGARCAELEALEDEVDRLATTPWPERRALLDRIAERAESLPHHRPLVHDELVRVDAASGLSLALSRAIVSELERFTAWYARLSAALYPRQRFVESHARRFLAVQPPDADVPLLDVIHGVFEPRDERRPTTFPAPRGADPLGARAATAYERVRERLAQEARAAAAEGREEATLEAIDWDELLGAAPAPSWSCGVLFQVGAASAAAVDAGRYDLAINGLYAGGGLAVARLAHLHAGDATVEHGPIARALREGWSWLERSGAVVAELSYMHGGRTANAGLRPSLFRHEIVLPGGRATPGRVAIPLEDLTLRFESGPRRFRLRWRSRGVDVMPIVSSGISPEGLVAFLIAVGQQDLQPLALFPGFEVEGVRRWPRFRFGRVVVFRRRWVFAAEETPLATPRPPLDAARALEVERWRRAQAIPLRSFAHTDAEPKPFLVDFASPWLVERLARALDSSRTLHLTEMLPDADAMWVRDAWGRYASEFLVHLRHLEQESSAP